MGITLPQDSAILLFIIYSKYTQSYHKDICSTMIIAALFVIAITWIHLRCHSTKKWIKKMWYIYIIEYYSAVKNNIMKFSGK